MKMGTRGGWSVLGKLAVLLLVGACGNSKSETHPGAGAGGTSAGGGAETRGGTGGDHAGSIAGGNASGGSGASGGLAGSGGSSDPGCALMQFRGEGYTLSVLGTGELASLQISTADFEAMAATDEPLETRWPAVVAPYFKKVFFWHLFMMHEHVSDHTLLGQNLRVTPAARGAGLGEPNERRCHRRAWSARTGFQQVAAGLSPAAHHRHRCCADARRLGLLSLAVGVFSSRHAPACVRLGPRELLFSAEYAPFVGRRNAAKFPRGHA